MRGLLLAAACVALTAGCGGVNASKSVSPLNFLLPGLLKADPPLPLPAVPATNRTDVLVAQVR
jgi:hypothetical protein